MPRIGNWIIGVLWGFGPVAALGAPNALDDPHAWMQAVARALANSGRTCSAAAFDAPVAACQCRLSPESGSPRSGVAPEPSPPAPAMRTRSSPTPSPSRPPLRSFAFSLESLNDNKLLGLLSRIPALEELDGDDFGQTAGFRLQADYRTHGFSASAYGRSEVSTQPYRREPIWIFPPGTPVPRGGSRIRYVAVETDGLQFAQAEDGRFYADVDGKDYFLQEAVALTEVGARVSWLLNQDSGLKAVAGVSAGAVTQGMNAPSPKIQLWWHYLGIKGYGYRNIDPAEYSRPTYSATLGVRREMALGTFEAGDFEAGIAECACGTSRGPIAWWAADATLQPRATFTERYEVFWTGSQATLGAEVHLFPLSRLEALARAELRWQETWTASARVGLTYSLPFAEWLRVSYELTKQFGRATAEYPGQYLDSGSPDTIETLRLGVKFQY